MNSMAHTTSYQLLQPQLQDRWSDLVRLSGVDVSMTPQWFESAIRSRGAMTRAHVFTLQDGDRLLGVIPYVVRTESVCGLPIRSRESPGSFVVAYHPEIISVIETQALLQKYLEDAAGNCDVVVLPNVESGGRTDVAARAAASRAGLKCLTRDGHASPFLAISGSWDEFLSNKSKKFRYKVRAAVKNLSDAGTVSHRWFSDRADTEILLSEMLRIEGGSWKAAAGMAVSVSGIEGEYYRLLLPFLAARGALHANVLYLDAVPIAYSLGYVSDGCVRQLKTSYDQNYARLSPGAACHQLAIRKAFEIGAREFDFLGDVMLHKRLWATGVRRHVSLYITLGSWRGRVFDGARRVSGWASRRGRAGAIAQAEGDHGLDG